MDTNLKELLHVFHSIEIVKLELQYAKLTNAPANEVLGICQRLNSLYACLNPQHAIAALKKAA